MRINNRPSGKLLRSSMLVMFSIIVMAYAVSGCYSNKIEPMTTCAPTAKDSVSFSQDIQPIFNQHCATSGCHSGSSPEGNLNLEAAVAYSQITRPKSGYLNTAVPSQSLLYSQLQSSSISPMPPSYRLDDCSVQTILKWMGQKAKSN